MNVLFKNYDNKFLEPLRTSKTIDQLNHSFKQICHAHGVRTFSIVELISNNDKPAFYTYSTYPDNWIKHYINNQYYEYDPVFVNPAHAPFPFYWHHNSVIDLTKQQQDLFKEAYSFGIRSGTTIPLTPTNGKHSYLTLLNTNVANNFDLMFWMRVVGDTYFAVHNDLSAIYY